MKKPKQKKRKMKENKLRGKGAGEYISRALAEYKKNQGESKSSKQKKGVAKP